MSNLHAHFELASVPSELAELHFLEAQRTRGYAHVVRREVKRAVPLTAVPARASNVRTVQVDSRTQAVADIDDAVLWVESWKTSGYVTVAAHCPDSAARLVDEVRSAVAGRTGDRLDVAFTDKSGGSRYVELTTRPWASIRDNYTSGVQSALDVLTAYEPDAERPSRLLLWHGSPGTGKTTAVRALFEAWRDWADGVVVTDPETLLADGKYLRRTVLDHDDEDRWQLVVLEDAESLLKPGESSRGLATLLNLCDGLLGQGLRCLFLITTNQSLDKVHPALVRAGRCLSRLEFGPLPADKASQLLGRQVASPMTLAEVLAVEPVSVVAEPERFGHYL